MNLLNFVYSFTLSHLITIKLIKIPFFNNIGVFLHTFLKYKQNTETKT